MSGYEKLLEINYKYGAIERVIPFYLEAWFVGYVVYYDLDKSLLADNINVANNQCVTVIGDISYIVLEEVIDAIK